MHPLVRLQAITPFLIRKHNIHRWQNIPNMAVIGISLEGEQTAPGVRDKFQSTGRCVNNICQTIPLSLGSDATSMHGRSKFSVSMVNRTPCLSTHGFCLPKIARSFQCVCLSKLFTPCRRNYYRCMQTAQFFWRILKAATRRQYA